MSNLEGIMLSDYLLMKCISKSGIADVYRARQNGEGNHEVVVKVFRPAYAQRETFRTYFMAEAEKVGQFDHPNILSLLEFGEGEELLYSVTPFIATGTLEDLLMHVGGKFSAMQAMPILRQLCSALHYAHDQNVIHGNIKPTNVFVAADGRILLADFGIAHHYDDSQQSLTRVGWGTAEYVAPEQSLGLVRNASDIYSLGALLFRMLTGQPPFTGQTPIEVLLKHVRQPTPSARFLVPTISDAVDDVLRMAMQKRSEQRFASAQQFSAAFVAAVTIAPAASPVAKETNMVVPQLEFEPIPSFIDPNTPVPTGGLAAFLVDPQTPVPFPSAATPSLTASFSSALSIVAAFPGEPPRKHFLEELDDGGTLFNGPVEWSPFAHYESAEEGVPLSASEYLQVVPPTVVASGEPEVASPPREEPVEREEKKTLGNSLHALLPIVVVLLLLLGLV
ncbi:MAG: serine/threonine protein kinase, partial [Chloroflexota bacterium]|nr:serine/threonine protein kinase [Chloroflexota bacterium]